MTEPWTVKSTREVWWVKYQRADGVIRRYMGSHGTEEKAREQAAKGLRFGWNGGISWGVQHVVITEISDDVEWLE